MKLRKNTIEKLGSGVYPDDDVKNLRYRVSGTTRRFIYRRMIQGRSFELNLGSVDLETARDMATRFNIMRPIEFITSQAKEEKAVGIETFESVAEDFFQWRVDNGDFTEGDVNFERYKNRVRIHVFPILGRMPLASIEPDDVAKVARSLRDKQETLSKALGITKAIFDWAKARKRFTGDNPADRGGALKYLMPKVKERIKAHHGALDPSRVPEFVKTLFDLNTEGARLFIFSILTATRSATARKAKWEDIDLKARRWVVRSDDLKVKENGTLVVPLCDKVIEFLGDPGDGLVFKSNQGEFSINEFHKIVTDLIKKGGDWYDEAQSLKLGKPVKITQHGIARACFKTWATDDANGNNKKYDEKIAELCLHHKIGDKYEGAYDRGEYLESRKRLMAEWADFCLSKIKNKTS